jgi:hypothetical protein
MKYRRYSQQTNVDIPSSCNGCYTGLRTPLNLCAVLCTGEAVFRTSAVHNINNLHVWETEDPHTIHHSIFQQRFRVNVWARIVDDYVIGPCVIQGHFRGIQYANFL